MRNLLIQGTHSDHEVNWVHYREQALAAQAMEVEIRRQIYAQLTEQGFKCTSAGVERSEWKHPDGTTVIVEEG